MKLTTTLLLAALAAPAALALPPGDPQPQFNVMSQGFFYSAGRSYLGINVEDVTKERVSALKLKEERGVEVTMVDQDAPAAKAGLKEHDVILDFNGSKVDSEEQFRRMVRETPPGRNVTLGISRDGSPMSIQVQLGDRTKMEAGNLRKLNRDFVVIPDVPEPPEMPDFNFDIVTPTYTPALGIQADTLGQQLGQYFGVKDGEGVLVKSVEKGSAAEKAGLKAGDVITRVENEKIADRSDLRRILRSHRDGGKVTMGIVRDKREQNLTVDLPAARRPRNSSGNAWVWPDMKSIEDWDWDSINSIGPGIRRTVQQGTDELQKAVRNAQLTVAREITPQVREALRNTQKQMQDVRKQLLKQQKELKKELRSEARQFI